MIKPTVGRIVWVFRTAAIDPKQPEQARICYVHSDRCINVAGENHDGHPFRMTSLTLVQPGDEPCPYDHAEWMPFQVGQAKAQGA